MHRTVVINVVGLTPELISAAHTPRLHAFLAGGVMANVVPPLPAVTTTVQTTYLTGKWPADHGVVANGWYFRDTAEVRFWLQSDRLVQSPRIWDLVRAMDDSFTCANLFWWYNMYSSADFAVTPRPMYPSDGRKIPDIYARPAGLRDELQQKLGTFPLFEFWGPATTIRSTRWIADAALYVDAKHAPTLTLIYLPHLDYVLQKVGLGADDPAVALDLGEVDEVAGRLIEHYEKQGVRVVVLSEYGITPVHRPVHLNRVLRGAGLLAVREELGRELLDAGASQAFAVADHQVAHVYVADGSRVGEVAALLREVDGVAEVLDADAQRAAHLDHPRSGELVVLAERDAFFTYYYWLDERRIPDFARTVDIHRKPGYDPAELFFDPTIRSPKLKAGLTLAKRKLGFRALMELIAPNAAQVRGSHGLLPATASQGPLLISRHKELVGGSTLQSPQVFDVLMAHLTR